MIINYKNIKNKFLLIGVVVFSFYSCESTDLYETFDDYTKNELVSVGAPSYLAVLTGNERVIFTMDVNSDSKIKKGVITWGLDESHTYDINRTDSSPFVNQVEITLPEGTYEFSTYYEDADGNKSLSTFQSGVVYGEVYRSSLFNRVLSDIVFETEYVVDDITLENVIVINWADAVTDTLVSTEVTYLDSSGTEQVIIVDSGESTTIIEDFMPESTFSYKTSYIPANTVIDEFQSDPTEGIIPATI